MKAITMKNVERLIDELENLESEIENIKYHLEQWRDLDGETDADSREERRDAREEIENNQDQLYVALIDTCEAMGIKTE